MCSRLPVPGLSALDASRYRETRLTYEAASNGLNVSQQQIVGMPSGVTVTQTFTWDTVDANAQAGLQAKNTFGCSEYRIHDELNRVTKIIDALNGETTFTYDLAGNRLTVKDAENKTWSFATDDLGRPTSETDHSAKTISYLSCFALR